MWPGYVKGLEVSLLDVLALAIYFAYPKVRVKSPFLIALPVYILAVLASVAISGTAEATLFYAWQLSRVLLLFVAVAKVCQDERGPPALLAGLTAGLCFQAGFAIQQRLSGLIQSSGTFGHQNLLGMVSHFVVFPALALLLVDGKRRAPLFGVVSGAIVVILGASRATIGLAGVGYVSLLLLSIVRKPTARKSMIVGLGMVALAVASPLALSSLQKRFDVAPLSTDYDERGSFERAAKMAIADHPFGVGANQYVVVANTQGYSERAGVIWNAGSRGANVHNTYLLVWAETGFLGLAAFIGFILTPILIAFRSAWRNRKDQRGDLMLGFGVSALIVSLHSFYEWIFVEYAVQSLFAINAGMIAGLAQQMAVGSLRKSRRTRHSQVGGPDITGVRETA